MSLILSTFKKQPNTSKVRAIKGILSRALCLKDTDIITITQLNCQEEQCSPVETVIGLLRSNMPQLQHKISKSIDTINNEDLKHLCDDWGYKIDSSLLIL
jgi:hypothetical protein